MKKRAAILYQKARTALDRGNVMQARSLLESAVRIDGKNAQIGGLHDAVVTALRNYQSAQSCYERLLSDDNDNVVAHQAMADLFCRQEMYRESLHHYREIIRLQPDNHDILNNYAIALQKAGAIAPAIQVYRKILELDRDHVAARYNLGLLLRDRGDYGGAEQQFSYLAGRDKSNAGVLNILGNIYHQLGRFDEALECFGRGLRIDPGQADLHYNRALTLLLSGEFSAGWREYAWHYRSSTCDWPDIRLPLWDGRHCDVGRLLVHGEQGVGDQIMMMSVIPDLLHRAGPVVIECDPRLVPLFSRSFQDVEVRADRYHEAGRDEGLCAYIPGSALFQYLRAGPASFPAHRGYLVPDSAAVTRWRERFARFGDDLKVGISWYGGAGNTRKRRARSIGLEQWGPIFSVPGVSFVNLQYGINTGTLEDLFRRQGTVIHDYADADPVRSLDDFAARIAALDLVISVDNTTVHMAGALGIPAWVMLPYIPDWRWLLTVDTSYWYPALRLFRQTVPGDWGAVIRQVAQTLAVEAGSS